SSAPRGRCGRSLAGTGTTSGRTAAAGTAATDATTSPSLPQRDERVRSDALQRDDGELPGCGVAGPGERFGAEHLRRDEQPQLIPEPFAEELSVNARAALDEHAGDPPRGKAPQHAGERSALDHRLALLAQHPRAPGDLAH